MRSFSRLFERALDVKTRDQRENAGSVRISLPKIGEGSGGVDIRTRDYETIHESIFTDL